MSKASRNKGARGEREFAELLREYGFKTARRAGFKQTAGGGEPDVECEELDYFHFEVKRVERLNLWGAIEQAKTDSGNRPDKIPVVVFRKNNSPWYAIVPARDMLKAVRKAEDRKNAD